MMRLDEEVLVAIPIFIILLYFAYEALDKKGSPEVIRIHYPNNLLPSNVNIPLTLPV